MDKVRISSAQIIKIFTDCSAGRQQWGSGRLPANWRDGAEGLDGCPRAEQGAWLGLHLQLWLKLCLAELNLQ